MRPNPQAPAHTRHTGGIATSGITRALNSQPFSHVRPRLFDGQIMAPGVKTFVANCSFLQYRTRTEIFFSAQSLALETNNSHSYGSMDTMWRSQ
jgi:hypothetical protein